jgi:hypothetical protein
VVSYKNNNAKQCARSVISATSTVIRIPCGLSNQYILQYIPKEPPNNTRQPRQPQFGSSATLIPLGANQPASNKPPADRIRPSTAPIFPIPSCQSSALPTRRGVLKQQFSAHLQPVRMAKRQYETHETIIPLPHSARARLGAVYHHLKPRIYIQPTTKIAHSACDMQDNMHISSVSPWCF